MNKHSEFFFRITWQTRANRPGLGHATLSIGSTRGGGAGVHWLGRDQESGVQRALDKRVTVISLITLAHGLVIDHCALSINATGAGARVQTLLANTGKVGGAVITEHTFWLTPLQGISLVVSDTLTHGLTTLHPALSIDATRVRVTGICGSRRLGSGRRLSASCEGVSNGAGRAAADRVVSPDLAHSVDSAGAGTRVNALLSYAGQTGSAVRVLQTLSPAACLRHWVSLESPPAGADHLASVVLAALSVGAAGGRAAGVGGHTAPEWVSSVAGQTPAVLRASAPHQALSVVSARPGLAGAGLVRFSQGHTTLDGVDGLGEARFAGAPLHIVDHHALCVLAARVGLAWLDWSDAGDGGGVALIPGQTVAHGPVSYHPTPGVGAALVSPALGAVSDASHEGVASLAAGARADGVAVVQLADGLHPAGGGHAGVAGHGDGGAAHVRVTIVAGLAGAYWVVVGKLADCVVTTEARTHRDTLPLESVTVFVLGTVPVLGTIWRKYGNQ